MKITRLLILLFSLGPQFGYCQTVSLKEDNRIQHQYHMKTDLVIITGYQIHRNHFGEIGIGIMKNVVAGHHPSTLVYGLSNELKISNDFIWGAKAGLWLGGGIAGMNMGFNMINYTDFQENTLRFRPEIGMGFGIFRIVYGYNFAIINKGFDGINKHNFGLNIMPKLKTLKIEKR